MLAEAGWDVWERLAALEPADPNKGSNGAGQLEAGLADMTAVLAQRNGLQVVAALLRTLPFNQVLPVCSDEPAMPMEHEATDTLKKTCFQTYARKAG